MPDAFLFSEVPYFLHASSTEELNVCRAPEKPGLQLSGKTQNESLPDVTRFPFRAEQHFLSHALVTLTHLTFVAVPHQTDFRSTPNAQTGAAKTAINKNFINIFILVIV